MLAAQQVPDIQRNLSHSTTEFGKSGGAVIRLSCGITCKSQMLLCNTKEDKRVQGNESK